MRLVLLLCVLALLAGTPVAHAQEVVECSNCATSADVDAVREAVGAAQAEVTAALSESRAVLLLIRDGVAQAAGLVAALIALGIAWVLARMIMSVVYTLLR